MRSEKEKMLAGEPYDSNDAGLSSERLRARSLCQRINALDPEDGAARQALFNALFATAIDAEITPPFHCDYGYNIRLGEKVYFNFGCVILDVVSVVIGHHTLFGPGVHIYTASHPMSAEARRRGVELGRPVRIGDDAWIGGGTIICPGVEIGTGAVIGAGSVVTRTVPRGVFAAGNPCRVIRTL